MAANTSKSKKPLGKRLVLLDAHAIIHRAYHALPEFTSSKGEPTGALYGICAMLIKIIADLKPDYVVAAYDLPEPTYRHEAYKEYKAGRAKAEPDLVAQLERSRDIFTAFQIPIYDKPGFEADDVIATIVEELKDAPIEVVIASGDMDTLQLVSGDRVKVYTLKKGIQDTILYDEQAVEARYGFGPELLPDYKGLRGDPSDNIIGIKGIGEKTATTLITTFGTIEAMYAQLEKDEVPFLKAGITPRMVALLKEGKDEALFSKMLATVRRDAPIDFSLPKKTFIESFDVPTAEALFRELEFRTLGTRLKEALGLSVPKEEVSKKQTSGEAGSLFGDQVDPKLFKETALALSVLNSNLAEPTLEDVLAYGKTESFDTAREVILTAIKKQNLEFVFEQIERPLIPIVERMEKWGIMIDKTYLADLSKTYHGELKAIEKKIFKAAGEEFNVNSPKQMSHILFEKLGLSIKNHKKTDGGVKSTRESELEKMKELHPIIEFILEHREIQKLLSTYIDPMPQMVAEDGRLHAHFLQIGAATGRMSSQNPGLQNIPIKSERGKNIRNGFISAPGFSLVAFDYAQIELKVAAFLSGDEKLIQIFRSGGDIHTAVAAEVFGVPPEQVDREMRRRAKVINFGILYGMGVNALRTNLGTDRAEAQKFYNDYFVQFSGLASYLDRMKAEANRKGYTETFFGRKRLIEGIRSPIPYIRASAERVAINAPVQGTEADIVKLAMIKVEDMLEKEGLLQEVRLLLQVHDELVYEIAEDKKDIVAPKIQKIMESIMPLEQTAGIKLTTSYAFGKRWGELK
jgi:DNA polymerase-1